MAPDPVRAGALVVRAMTLAGIPAGLVWAWQAPSAAEVAAEPSLAVSADALFGVVAAVAGVALTLITAEGYRERGMAYVVGVAVGGLCGSAVMLAIGVALGRPVVAALPMLLLWSVSGLVVVVAVGVTYGLGPADHQDSAESASETSPDL